MRRIEELDGLRGAACLSVLLAHYFGEVAHGYRLFTLGWLGVDVFFCLSGFLIGGILLDNRDTVSYSRAFYIRRAFRIFPIYYLTIITLFMFLNHFSSIAHYARVSPVIWYLTYTQNMLAVITNSQGGIWLRPTWTLCVEEQFYLILPLVLYLCPRRFTFQTLIWFIASASIFRVGLAIAGAGEIAFHVLLPARWDLLFLGVLGAYIYRNENLWTFFTTRENKNLKLLTVPSVLLIPFLGCLDRYFNFTVFLLFGNVFVGIAFTGYILLIVSGAPEGARFRGSALKFFGSISYGLYLIHQPIAGILHAAILNGYPDISTPAQLAVTVGAAGVSILIAYLSWTYFERPLIAIGHRWACAAATPPQAISESCGLGEDMKEAAYPSV